MADNSAQKHSPSYRLAVEDTDFLLRDEMRSARFMLEFAKAELALRDWGVRSTVVMFGSARVPAPEHPAAAGMPLAAYYEQARELARIVSLRGGALGRNGGLRDNVIATGGGPGIMEAANRGAADVGAPSIGFNITLPHEQNPNAYSTPALTFRFHYFAMRKMHLAMRANALVVFPGGFGTFDELFEVLTLIQTRKAPPVAVLLFGRDYWQRVVNWDLMRDNGLIDAADLDLFHYADTPEEAWDVLAQHRLTAHSPEAGSEG